MQATSFPCPHCSVTLRLKQRKVVGKQIDCPDCSQPVLIVADGRYEVSARCVAVNPEQQTTRTVGDRSAVTTKTPDRIRQLRMSAVSPETVSSEILPPIQRCVVAMKSPAGVAWSVAAICIISLIMTLYPFGFYKSSRDDVQLSGVISVNRADLTDAKSQTANAITASNSEKMNVQTRKAQENQMLVDLQLRQLGQQIADYYDERHHFPRGSSI